MRARVAGELPLRAPDPDRVGAARPDHVERDLPLRAPARSSRRSPRPTGTRSSWPGKLALDDRARRSSGRRRLAAAIDRALRHPEVAAERLGALGDRRQRHLARRCAALVLVERERCGRGQRRRREERRRRRPRPSPGAAAVAAERAAAGRRRRPARTGRRSAASRAAPPRAEGVADRSDDRPRGPGPGLGLLGEGGAHDRVELLRQLGPALGWTRGGGSVACA